MVRKKQNIKRKKQKAIFYLTVITMILIVVLSIINFKQKSKEALITTGANLQEQKKFIVCLDAGHGGYDKGCTSYTGIKEKDTTLKVTLELGKRLEKQGFKVVYTRTSDDVSWPANEKKDIRERVNISNNAKANMFVSIHCNMYKSSRFKGFEVWCNKPNSEEDKLAKEIKNQLSELKYTDCEGVKYTSQRPLGVLRDNKATSVLVELGYVSNKSDDKYVNSIQGQEKLVQAVEKAIVNYKNSIK